MNKLDYICITCKHFLDRHDHIFRQHEKYLSDHFSLPHLVLDHDIDSGLAYTSHCYSPHLWERHMQCVLPFHAFNYLSIQSSVNATEVRNALVQGSETINNSVFYNSFAPRLLKPSEHSLIHKHYEALLIASSSSLSMLVIEDDALINSSSEVEHILMSLKSSDNEPLFVNLVPAPHCTGNPKPNTQLYPTSIAKSFTTGAYILSPAIAIKLVENFFPYSMPIDFHLQYLFKLLSVKGLTSSTLGINNGSQTSQMSSTIQ